MFKRVLVVATLALLVAGCLPPSSIVGTWGQPTREHAERIGAVVTRTEASASAAQAASCTAAAAGACGGCSVTCPVGKPAQCSSGETRYASADSGRAPVCRREAACACG